MRCHRQREGKGSWTRERSWRRCLEKWVDAGQEKKGGLIINLRIYGRRQARGWIPMVMEKIQIGKTKSRTVRNCMQG